jgi:glutathione synthase/RimK-type ligase-like ATP-grasp enzyme
MTKVLIISNKSDITSDFIVKQLKEKCIDFFRFNTDELTKSINCTLDLHSNSFFLHDTYKNEKINLNEITAVYFRRPELPIIKSKDLNRGEIDFIQNEILYTLEGIYKLLRKAYWVSPIYSIREAENKIFQLEIAKMLKLKIPNSIISNRLKDLSEFYTCNKGNCIIKPIKSGLIEEGNNSKIIYTSLLDNKPSSKEQINSCPNFLQSHISKKGDVRVTMVGNKAFATMIHSQEKTKTKVDWRKSEESLKHTRIELPSDIKVKCVQLLKNLNLRFGAIDFVLDKNEEFTFLEINPNGQWAWIEKLTGYKISNEITNLLIDESF